MFFWYNCYMIIVFEGCGVMGIFVYAFTATGKSSVAKKYSNDILKKRGELITYEKVFKYFSSTSFNVFFSKQIVVYVCNSC